MKAMKVSRQREPSRASLREMPEVDFSKARRNPYAARIAKEGITIQIGRARPRQLVAPSAVPSVSVDLPKTLWKRVEARAAARGISVETALREAIIEWATEAA